MKPLFCISLLIIGFTGIVNLSRAQDTPYALDKTISIPGVGGYDYLTIDEKNYKLYVTHGGVVNVIDLKTDKPVAQIEDLEEAHGVAIAQRSDRGFISDGKANQVVVFDLKTYKKIKTISIKGVNPDAIVFDPATNRVFTFNSGNSTVTVIDADNLKVIGNIDLEGPPEAAVVGKNGRIYCNLTTRDAVQVIDTRKMATLRQLPLGECKSPTGLAIDNMNKRLFSACRISRTLNIIDDSTGMPITSLPLGEHNDGVIYDHRSKMVFASNGDGTVNIFSQTNANEYKLVQNLTTQRRARTMAYDARSKKLYLSVAEYMRGTRTILPKTFKVLVYKRN